MQHGEAEVRSLFDQPQALDQGTGCCGSSARSGHESQEAGCDRCLALWTRAAGGPRVHEHPGKVIEYQVVSAGVHRGHGTVESHNYDPRAVGEPIVTGLRTIYPVRGIIPMGSRIVTDSGVPRGTYLSH